MINVKWAQKKYLGPGVEDSMLATPLILLCSVLSHQTQLRSKNYGLKK